MGYFSDYELFQPCSVCGKTSCSGCWKYEVKPAMVPWKHEPLPGKAPKQSTRERELEREIEQLQEAVNQLEEQQEVDAAAYTSEQRRQRREARKQIKFLMEMFTKTVGDTERGLVETLRKNPKDQAARNAYVDWLLEHERTDAAELVRKGFTP